MPDANDKAEAMKHILLKLEDVYNSQAALNQKIVAIQLELEAVGDEELEGQLAEAAGHAHDNAQLVKKALDHFEMRINALEAGNT